MPNNSYKIMFNYRKEEDGRQTSDEIIDTFDDDESIKDIVENSTIDLEGQTWFTSRNTKFYINENDEGEESLLTDENDFKLKNAWNKTTPAGQEGMIKDGHREIKIWLTWERPPQPDIIDLTGDKMKKKKKKKKTKKNNNKKVKKSKKQSKNKSNKKKKSKKKSKKH